MAITNGYCSLPEAKNWIGLNDNIDDAQVENLVTAVSRWIDQYCDRHFWQFVGARYFDSNDRQVLNFGAYNDLLSVTSVKTDDNNDGVYETTWAAADYQLLPRNNAAAPESRPYRALRSTGNKWFPIPWAWLLTNRVGLVEVTGTWGWAAIPTAVNQACRMQVSRELQRQKSPEGVSGWGEFGPMRISGRLDPDVAEFLADYTLRVVVA